MTTAVHLLLESGVLRCNRQGMRGSDGKPIGGLWTTADPAAVTCKDCNRLMPLPVPPGWRPPKET